MKNLFKQDFIFNTLAFILLLILPWQTRWIFHSIKISDQTWEYGQLGLYASMILLVILLASLYSLWHLRIHRVVNDVMPGAKNLRVNSAVGGIRIIFILYLIILAFFSSLPALSFYYLGMLFLACLSILVWQKIKAPVFYAGLLASGAVQGIFVWYQMLMQTSPANKWLGLSLHSASDLGTSVVQYDLNRMIRAYGSLPHPNILGGFLLFSLWGGIWWWLHLYSESKEENWQISKIKKHLLPLITILISIILVLFALFFTFSRSAVLAWFVSLVVVIFLSFWRKKFLALQIFSKAFLLSLVILLSVNFLFPGAWYTRLKAQGDLEAISLAERRLSFTQIDWHDSQRLILGQGLGANTYLTYQKNNLGEQNLAPYVVQPIHNFYLLVLAESGLITCLFLLYFLFKAWRKKHLQKPNLISLGLLISVLIVSLLDHYLWTTWTGILLLAITLSLFIKKED